MSQAPIAYRYRCPKEKALMIEPPCERRRRLARMKHPPTDSSGDLWFSVQRCLQCDGPEKLNNSKVSFGR